MVLPSKNIIPIFLACGIAVASIVFAVSYTPKPVAAPRASLTVLSGAANKPEINVENTDLKDWKNTLSQFDGSTNVQISTTGEAPAPAPDTTTSQLAKDIFNEYMSLKKENGQITLEEQSAILENVLLSNELRGTLSKSHGEIYTEYDLNISKDISKNAVRAYGNGIGHILKTRAPQTTDTELSILETMITTGDESAATKFDPIIASYNHIVDDLVKLQVPESMISFHLTLINQFSTVIAVDENMKKLFNDPARALTALKEFEAIATDIAHTIKAGSEFIQDQGITYSQSESGYVFANAI